VERATNEIKRFKAWINNLISVQALPAIWSGGQPSQIVSASLDMLVKMLGLDFAYVLLNDSTGGASFEMARLAQDRNPTSATQKSARNFIFDGKLCIPRIAVWLISRNAIV